MCDDHDLRPNATAATSQVRRLQEHALGIYQWQLGMRALLGEKGESEGALMYSSQYDPLPGVLMLLALAFLCGACVGIALGYWLALHRRRRRVLPEPDVQTESTALDAREERTPSEAWIDRLEQEINGR